MEHWFYWTKLYLFSQNSNISQVISGITKPILGMLVFIWMHFSWWFQIWSWNSTILIYFTKFVKFLTCRLHSPAARKALRGSELNSCLNKTVFYHYPYMMELIELHHDFNLQLYIAALEMGGVLYLLLLVH